MTAPQREPIPFCVVATLPNYIMDYLDKRLIVSIKNEESGAFETGKDGHTRVIFQVRQAKKSQDPTKYHLFHGGTRRIQHKLLMSQLQARCSLLFECHLPK